MIPLNTVSVVAAVTPDIVSTWFSHYLNREALHEKPVAHISYDLGLHLVRSFVEYSALHTIEELQAFTGRKVPVPHWVKSEDIEIPRSNITAAAEHLQRELGPEGIEQVGGKQWWQWRRDNGPLKAEWIEMRKDYNERKKTNDKGRRVMMYIHGGAYYFGSVDEHRYQIQRHARKLKARCLAPRYRLSPQFPFPCGLHDALSSYLYLLNEFEPSSIILAGDSAGGGMTLSLLIVLRDQGIPLPAGAILISPWVDLMHSFPSLSGDGKLDYIPSDGFIHKPSMGWPPPTLEAVEEDTMPSGVAAAPPQSESQNEVEASKSAKEEEVETKDQMDAERGFSVAPIEDLELEGKSNRVKETDKKYRDNMTGRIEGSAHIPSVMIDGKLIQIRDQIQMYAPNHLLTHPLVSPALQPSLGGLPPLLIQVGGGEMLRDEQIYIAHKAANPARYPPSKEILDKYDPDRKMLHKYRPTDVQLQVWEDLCHVGHTLSWTRPVKYMYRSVAQFGAWALAHAQKRPIDIDYDSGTESEGEGVEALEDPEKGAQSTEASCTAPRRFENTNTLPLPSFAPVAARGIGVAGDPLPPFENHMIRQRVDRHGKIHGLAPVSELVALQLAPEEIGVLKEGPVRKWLARQEKWNKKFASTKRSLQKKRRSQLEKGYVGIPEGEKPPPTALAGRRTKDLPRLAKIKKSYGMSMWSVWGSKHDQIQLERETVAKDLEELEEQPQQSRSPTKRGHHRSRSGTQRSRSVSGARHHSRRPSIRTVIDEGQAASSRPQTAPHEKSESPSMGHTRSFSDPNARVEDEEKVETVIPFSRTGSTRPTHNGIAYPFRLKVPETEGDRNSSIMTLNSEGDDQSEIGAEKQSAAINGAVDKQASSAKKATDISTTVDGEGKKEERPPMERFVTAAENL